MAGVTNINAVTGAIALTSSVPGLLSVTNNPAGSSITLNPISATVNSLNAKNGNVVLASSDNSVTFTTSPLNATIDVKAVGAGGGGVTALLGANETQAVGNVAFGATVTTNAGAATASFASTVNTMMLDINIPPAAAGGVTELTGTDGIPATGSVAFTGSVTQDGPTATAIFTPTANAMVLSINVPPAAVTTNPPINLINTTKLPVPPAFSQITGTPDLAITQSGMSAGNLCYNVDGGFGFTAPPGAFSQSLIPDVPYKLEYYLQFLGIAANTSLNPKASVTYNCYITFNYVEPGGGDPFGTVPTSNYLVYSVTTDATGQPIPSAPVTGVMYFTAPPDATSVSYSLEAVVLSAGYYPENLGVTPTFGIIPQSNPAITPNINNGFILTRIG